MSQTCDFTDKTCAPCNGETPALSPTQARENMRQLHNGWVLSDDAKTIQRKFTFKAFARAVYTANMAAFIADQQGHHPDIAFGWGYCTIDFTTHEIDGLSENDFICAAKIDQAVAT